MSSHPRGKWDIEELYSLRNLLMKASFSSSSRDLGRLPVVLLQNGKNGNQDQVIILKWMKSNQGLNHQIRITTCSREEYTYLLILKINLEFKTRQTFGLSTLKLQKFFLTCSASGQTPATHQRRCHHHCWCQFPKTRFILAKMIA